MDTTPASLGVEQSNQHSADLNEIIEIESILLTRLAEAERRVYGVETAYIENTSTPGRPSHTGFGNCISGWEGLLDSKPHDKKRLSERVFSEGSSAWRWRADVSKLDAESFRSGTVSKKRGSKLGGKKEALGAEKRARTMDDDYNDDIDDE